MYLSGGQKIAKSMNGLLVINASEVNAENASINNISEVETINGIAGENITISPDILNKIILNGNTDLIGDLDVSGNLRCNNLFVDVSGSITTINNLTQINGSVLDDITITSDNNLILDVITEANNNLICNNNFFSNSSAYFIGTTNLRNTLINENCYLLMDANPIANIKMSMVYDPATIGFNYRLFGADANGKYLRWIVKDPYSNDIIALQVSYSGIYTAIEFLLQNNLKIIGGKIRFDDNDGEIEYLPNPDINAGWRFNNIRNDHYTNFRNRDPSGNDIPVLRLQYNKITSEVPHQFSSGITGNTTFLNDISCNGFINGTLIGSIGYDASGNTATLAGICQSGNVGDSAPWNNFNADNWLYSSRVTSIFDNVNGPFGTQGWYNIFNNRHRGGNGSGNTLYGVQIVTGMTGNRNRMAFRGQNNGTWDSWTELQTKNTDASFNNMTLNGTLNISSAFGADNANAQLSVVNTTNSKGFKFSTNATDNLYSTFVSPGDSVISTNQYNNSSFVITTNTSENHGIKLTSQSGISNIRIENASSYVNLSNSSVSLGSSGANSIVCNSPILSINDLNMSNKINLNSSSAVGNKIVTTNIISADVSGNPNTFKYSTFQYNSNNALGTNQPIASFSDAYNNNCFYYLPNASVGAYNLIVSAGDAVITSAKLTGVRDSNALCMTCDATQRVGVRCSATSSTSTKVELYASATKNMIIDSTSGVSLAGISSLTFNDATIQSTAYTSALNTKLNAIGTISTASLTASTTLTSATGADITASALSLSAGTYMISWTCTFKTTGGSTTINNYSAGFTTSTTSYSNSTSLSRGSFGGATIPTDQFFNLQGQHTINFASTTNIYLRATAVFGTATRLVVDGTISQLIAVKLT